VPHTNHEVEKGAANGLATLDGSAEIPAAQLVKATTAPLNGIGTPTYQTLQDMVDVLQGAGCIDGGIITQNGVGYDVAAGQGVIRSSASPTAPLLFFDWTADLANTIADGEVRWVYIDYNGGSPIITDTVTFGSWDWQTQFPLGSVAREGSDIYIMAAPQKVSDSPALVYQWLREVLSFARDNIAGGLQLSSTGTRNVITTGGNVWVGLERFTLTAMDTSVSDVFDYYYRDGGGGWNKLTAQTQWSNTQYDDGTGTLATLLSNRYAAVWVYLTLDGSLALVFGQDQSTSQATIEDSAPPLVIPTRLQANGFLIGRFIIQQNNDTPIDEQSIYSQTFNAATLTDHGQLAGLAGDDHTQYQLRSEQDQANGYPSLDGSTLLALAQIPTITNAKLADMATQTFKGRTTGGTGDPEDLTTAQATALLDLFTSGLKGLVPASGGGTTNFLRADGTFAAPPGGGGGDITVEDEGTPLTTAVTKFNFAGAGVTVTEPVADEVLVTVPGGSGDPTSDIAEANGDITTTSGTDILATGMTLTPAAGNYLVWFSSTFSNSSNNSENFGSIWAGGAQVAESEREWKRGAGQGNTYSGFSCMAKVTVNGAEAIEGRWRVNGGTGTMHNGRQLMILKVA